MELEAIGKRIKKIRQERGLSQTEVANGCEKYGISTTQGTISSVENNGTKNFVLLYTISKVLNADLSALFSEDEFTLPTVSKVLAIAPDNHSFVTDPNADEFNGYLGNYFTYFYKTASNKNRTLVFGELTFKKSDDDRSCLATFCIYTGQHKTVEGQSVPVKKYYTGQLIISRHQQSAYCYLHSDQYGEICLLIFHYFRIFNDTLKSIIANVVTVSSGNNPRPVTHRMCLSNRKFTDEEKTYLKGQLLQNDSHILLTESQYEKMINDDNVPASVKDKLKKSASKHVCYNIPENDIAVDMEEKDFLRLVSYIRSFSSAPLYNKISSNSDNAVFGLVENQSE